MKEQWLWLDELADWFRDHLVLIAVGVICILIYVFRMPILILGLSLLGAAEEAHALLDWAILLATLVNFVLLLWILLRTPRPWRIDAIYRRLSDQLNRIEATVRGVPIEEVEERESDFWRNAEAAEKGRPWFAPRF